MDTNYEKILSRLKTVLSAKADADVARGLDVSTAAVSSFKRQGKFPYERLVKFCLAKGISVDWLLTGEGPMKRPVAGQALPTALDHELLKDIIIEVEKDLASRGKQLPPDKKAEVITLIYEEIIEDEEKKSAMGEKVIKLIRLAS